MLRYAADRRTMLWAFVFFPALPTIAYAAPTFAPYLIPIALYLGFSAGVFSHNHNHVPTFASKRLNAFYAMYLSFFYGFPTFAWIPTHNLNHHRYVNKPGDATITWRYSKKNTWLIASTYFWVSTYWQSDPIKEYLTKARARNPRLFRQAILQYAVVYGGHALMFALAVALHGLRLGALAYVCGLFIPSAFALWSMIFINYLQHVHCDPWSKHNHSRNFVGRLGNFLVFNNGFHTVHHENAGAHWSELPLLHQKIAHKIHPELNQQSIFGFCFKAYLFGIFNNRFRTQQIGRAPYESPTGETQSLATAEVSAEDLGANVGMV